jgi:hypothetical protein
MEKTENVIFRLVDYIESHNFKGYDPYDGLNSELLKFLPLPGKYPKIAWIQFFKIFPINLRRLFLIPKGLNPKGLGLVLSSYCNLFKLTKNVDWLIKAQDVSKILISLKSKEYDNFSWGYNFNWQSRAFYVPQDTPTIVNTSFICHGLLDLYLLNNDKNLLKIVSSSCKFILNDLNRYEDGNQICFSYTPIDNIRVHNANILGAGLIARYSEIKNINTFDSHILKCYNYLADHQNSNGSWYYAETNYQNWIDSFHTAFNLFSLEHIYSHFQNKKEILKTIKSGKNFYINNFFRKDGSPKYYHDRIYPIDIHSSSMALAYLCKYADNHKKLIGDIFSWKIENMLSRKGYFYFRKNQYFTNKISYMRWSQTWALYGLTQYALSEETS